jgi:hypothetical protein
MDDREASEGHSALWLALQRLTRGAGIQREDILEALAGELSELQRYWGTNLNRSTQADREMALREAQYAISSNLRIHINGLKPPRGVPPQKFIHVIDVSFNIQRDKLHLNLKDADLSERRNWLARKAPAQLRVSVKTSQRYLNHAISQIEQQVLSSGYQPINTDSAPEDEDSAGTDSPGLSADPISPEFSTPYIPRDRLFVDFMHAWLIKDVPEGQWPFRERICLVGDAGTGKTRFIRELLAATEVDVLWVNAEAEETMVPAMLDVLRAFVNDTSSLTEASLIKRAFGRLLAHPDGPALVVIDGIPDPAALDQFIPRSTDTCLIVTSRQRPPRNWSPVVEVGGMEPDEADRMVVLLLTDASTEDRQALSIMMGFRPRLIEHACAFLRQDDGMSVQEFCAAVGSDIEATLTVITDTTDRALTAIYRRYVERLTQDAPASLRLLELLPFIAHLHVPPEYLMAYLLGVPYIKPEHLARGRLAYEAAIKPLEACSLVTVDKLFGVSMSPFVQNVLRRIFADRIYGITVQAGKTLKVERAQLHAAGWSALTVAGRETCNRVLFTHVKDLVLDGGRLARDGTIGGIQWGVLVGTLWVRHVKWELILMIAEGRLPMISGGHVYDWDAFLEGADKLPRLQRDEWLGVKMIAESIAPSRDADPEPSEPTTTQEQAEGLADSIAKLVGRYETSSVGQLDLSIVNTWAFDESQQAQIREGLSEMLNAALQGKDEDEGTQTTQTRAITASIDAPESPPQP